MALTNAERGGPDPIDVLVGLKIRELRRGRRMSQASLGQKLGITFQQIQKYERGANRISASMLVRAADAFEVPPASLLPDSTAAAPESSAILYMLTKVRGANEMVEVFSRTPPRLRTELLRFARSLAAEADQELELET
jgi:transcriptional regulator with XRE-family HTH domain